MFFQAAFLRKADVLKPKHLLGEMTNLNTLPIEKFKTIVLENSETLTTERYPGYKRGTKSFAGTLFKKEEISARGKISGPLCYVLLLNKLYPLFCTIVHVVLVLLDLGSDMH